MRNLSNAWKTARRVSLLLILFASVVTVLTLTATKQSAQDERGATKDEPQDTQINTNTKQIDFSQYYKADNVTKVLRDKSKVPVRVMVNNDADREQARKLGTVIEDYGTFVVVAASRSQSLSLSKLDAATLSTTVHLPGKSFEPLQNPPAQTVTKEGASVNFGGKDYYIVQLGGPTKDEWLDSLRDAGVEVLQYVPHQAFFVYGDAEAIQKVAGNSRVRWVGRFTGEDKLSSVLNEQLAAAKGAAPLNSKISSLEMTGNDRAIFDVAIWSRADLNAVREAVSAYGQINVKNEIRLPSNFFNVLRVEMPVDAVAEIAKLSDVIRIDPWGKPRAEDERAAQIIAGNYTNTTTINAPGYNPLTQFGVDGTNVTVSVVDDGVGIPGDGGFYVTATNTVHGPLRSASAGANGHGHLNASIIAGDTPFSTLDPTGYNYGSGIAPKAHTINIPLLRTGYTGTEADCYNDTVVTAGPNGVNGFISNNSWGFGTNGNVYDSFTSQFDGFVRDASAAGAIDPILIVFSAGNSGGSGLTRPKVAKNVIAVASSENLRSNLDAGANNMDDVSSFSSRGLSADGRVKPDITAPGQAITGGRSGSDVLFGNIDAAHRWSSGTSHAAPQVAGAAALFTQFWKNNNGGNNPSPALAKAAILLTGQEMAGVGSGNPLPNGDEGWGRINMRLMLNTGVPVQYVNQTTAFTATGNSSVMLGKVADATKPVRIALVWTDPPATADPALINNLDLTVTVGGNTYRGNVFTNGVSTSGGAADTKNNVEQVRLAAGVVAGTSVVIQINATGINGDGILGNADMTDQHFALVAYNITPASKVKPADFDGDSKTDISIFRPSVGEWWYQQSSDSVTKAFTFGSSTDRIVPGDYDGDNKTDIAIWRPSTAEWFVLRSSNMTFFSAPFGVSTDTPAPGDFDGDLKTDLAVFRVTSGTGRWFVNKSTGGVDFTVFGTTGDIPAVGDYDGDNRDDICVFRPTGGSGGAEWWMVRSSAGFFVAPFGASTDKPVQGDYTGDGKADIAFFRPSTNTWFVLRSEDSSYYAAPFGASGDLASPGDYDGDGKTDIAVFRPTGATWFVQRSTGGVTIQSFGTTGDKPVPGAYVP